MDNQNLNALFKTVTVRDLLWPFEATKAICDTLKLCYENEKYQYNNNSKGAEMCNEIETYQYNIPGFLTWIAQVAAEYPILSYLACVWYQ